MSTIAVTTPADQARTAEPADDLRKRLKPLFNPPRTPVLVDVPELNFLVVDGRGAPPEEPGAQGNDFQLAIQTVYPVAYTLKFRLKAAGVQVPIMPLEGLWSTGDSPGLDLSIPPEDWSWRLAMAMPDDVTPELVAEALADARRKKPGSAPADLRLERWREGRCAQVMHVGPYREERPTIDALHAFIAAQGLVARGAHHEIYMGDPRSSDPAKLKTVIRQPVAER